MKYLLHSAMIVIGALCVQQVMALSAPVFVNTSLAHNRHWEAVSTNKVDLSWDWEEGAVSATLDIVGMNSSKTVNFTEETTTYSWLVFANGDPLIEDVFDLVLTFKDTNGATVGEVLNARLASVKDKSDSITVNCSSEETPWPSIRSNVVIPYDSTWDVSTMDATTSQIKIEKQGVEKTEIITLPDASGYFGWKIVGSEWKYGLFDLTLSFAEVDETAMTWEATLKRPSEGMLFMVR